MRILIDIGHPAHVHLLQFTSEELKEHGHTVFFFIRDIPVAKRLMDIHGMPKEEARKQLGLELGKKYGLFSSSFDNEVKYYPLAKATIALLPEVNRIELKGYSRLCLQMTTVYRRNDNK